MATTMMMKVVLQQHEPNSWVKCQGQQRFRLRNRKKHPRQPLSRRKHHHRRHQSQRRPLLLLQSPKRHHHHQNLRKRRRHPNPKRLLHHRNQRKRLLHQSRKSPSYQSPLPRLARPMALSKNQRCGALKLLRRHLLLRQPHRRKPHLQPSSRSPSQQRLQLRLRRCPRLPAATQHRHRQCRLKRLSG